MPGYELGETGVHGERFLDKQSIEGTIEEMIKYAEGFVFRNTKTMYVIDSNGERKNKHEYPMDAIKEAIINALVHRDYYLISAPISLNIFSDRIEITSPGGLYGNVKENDLENKENMELRNPSIVKILEEMDNIIENRKTGISTMKKLMKEHGLPEPEFEITEKSFTVIFRNTNPERKEFTKEELLNIRGGRRYLELLHYCTVPKTISEIGKFLHISSRSYISTKILKPLLERGNLEYYYKKNIHAKGQKYVTKF